MCYAIPGKVKRFEDKFVVVDYFGEERKAYNELDGLQLGDYIYAQGGYAIKRIPPDEAQSILSVWKETFFELQEVDLQLSQIDLEKQGVDKKLNSILDKINHGFKVKDNDLLYLLSLSEQKEIDLLLKNANFLRQKHHKNACCVHGIIEISNKCSRNCFYCGISTHNKDLKRYQMSKDEIFEAAKEAVEVHGFKALVLQSGDDAGYNISDLVDAIKRIRTELGALIFISFGEIGIDGLKELYTAGARGLLLRFETSNPEIYEKLHPGFKLDARIEHIKKAYEMGYLIATGGLIGLPDQTNQDILNDIYLAKELKAEMYSFGPFLAHPDTPLASQKPVSQNNVLKALAVARFVDQENAKILITTAFETLSKDARKKGLLSGANSVMLNATPMKYRDLYSIYPDRAHGQEKIQDQIKDTISLLRQLGRAPTDLGVNT
jgi:biotin synthase